MESELAEQWSATQDNMIRADTPVVEIEGLIQSAEDIKILCGSITTEQGPGSSSRGLLDEIKITLSAIREKFGESPPPYWKNIIATLHSLMEPTSGIIDFLDAVPESNFEVDAKPSFRVDVDILNPHYPNYYREPRGEPSDDQNPIPVYFLAVSPGTQFTFAVRLARPIDRCENDLEPDASALLDLVTSQLNQALSEWGIGAKTAAGYGYFEPEIEE